MPGLVQRLQSAIGASSTALQNVLNRAFPPEKRKEMSSKVQGFAINNPKLAAFLTAQIIFTGLPLLLFITFTITVFLFSLITTLLIGLIAALLFTASMVGLALVVFLPTVFLTTFGATFVFLWGLGFYSILKWVSERERPFLNGTALGDKVDSFTGGHMRRLLDGARSNQKASDGQKIEAYDTKKEDTEGSVSDDNTPASSSASIEKRPIEEFPAKHTETVKELWMNTNNHDHGAAKESAKSRRFEGETTDKEADISLGLS